MNVARRQVRRDTLVALVSHLELQKSDWWDSTRDTLILSALYARDSASSLGELRKSLRENFGLRLSIAETSDIVDRLITTDRLLGSRDSFKLSQNSLTDLERRRRDREVLEQEARSRFVAHLENAVGTLPSDDLWVAFRDEVLTALVKSVGASIWQSDNDTEPASVRSAMRPFAERFPEDSRAHVAGALSSYVLDTTPAVRQYLLHLLGGMYALQAAGLERDQIVEISDLAQAGGYTAYLDTNTFFSLLNIHDNPSNRSSQALIEVSKGLPDEHRLELKILTRTLGEAKSAIGRAESRWYDHFGREPLSVSVAEHQLLSRASLWGLHQGFVAAVAEGRAIADPTIYFRALRERLVVRAEELGIGVVDEKLAGVDHALFVEQLELSRRHNRQQVEQGRRGKPDGSLNHDEYLRAVVNSHRGTTDPTATSTRHWVLTVDDRLLALDRRRAKTTRAAPVCVSPLMMAELLRFWVPNTSAVDAATLAGLSERLQFIKFDQDAENATMRIMSALQRLESGTEPIPHDIAVKVLVDGELLSRVLDEDPGRAHRFRPIQPRSPTQSGAIGEGGAGEAGEGARAE